MNTLDRILTALAGAVIGYGAAQTDGVHLVGIGVVAVFALFTIALVLKDNRS